MVVVLDEVDDVLDGEHAGESRGIGVPKGCGNDSWGRFELLDTDAFRTCMETGWTDEWLTIG